MKKLLACLGVAVVTSVLPSCSESGEPVSHIANEQRHEDSLEKGSVVFLVDVGDLEVYFDEASPLGDNRPQGNLDASGRAAFELPAGPHKVTLFKRTSSHSYFLRSFMFTIEADKEKTERLYLRKNFAANSCEFLVDGFAVTTTYNQGWSSKSMLTELKGRMLSDSEPERVGQWIRYVDEQTGNTEEVYERARFVRNETQPWMMGKWVIEHAFQGTDMPDPAHPNGTSFSHRIVAFAYFVDVTEPDGFSRIWMSNNGRNFSLDETMSGQNYIENRGSTEIKWSNQSVPLFFQKKVCAP